MGKIYTAIGLMSGTSLDGVDVSIIQSDGEKEFSSILDRYFEYNKELVQKINAQNNYDAEPTGDEISSAKWLIEKLAEIIHRDEDRIELNLGFTSIVEEILDLIDTTGNRIQDWIANDQYPNAYLAICFYKSEIQAEGYSCGVKHVNRWIKAQFVVYNSSVSSRLYAFLHTSLSSWVFTNNQEFLEICWVRSLIEYVADSTGHRCKCRLC